MPQAPREVVVLVCISDSLTGRLVRALAQQHVTTLALDYCQAALP